MANLFIKTFGCQMNEHDSQKMEALLAPQGYQRISSATDADVIILNTCSIREKSYQKAVSQIGQLSKKRGSRKPVLVVTGCVVSHEGGNLLKKFPSVDMAIGPDHIASLPRFLQEVKKNRRIVKNDFLDISDYEFPTPIVWVGQEKKATAYVTIMKGCDNRCSFCIVPFVRGKEVSRPSEEILEEIVRLQGQGVREVMLLGQNVNSYGKGLSEGAHFAQLLRMIDERTEIARIRYTSPHPKDLSRALAEEYGRNEKLCPHIHLPVQSGSNRVLKRMRRSYTREVYLRKIEMIRKVLPEIAVTTDLIIGFPGESEEDFQKTLSLIREVEFDASYSFAFSPRPGTEAAGFFDDVPLEIKKERLTCLQELQASISLAKNRSLIGSIQSVLVEGRSRLSSQALTNSDGGHRGSAVSPPIQAQHPALPVLSELTGKTPQGKIVNFDGGEDQVGAILNIEITGASAYSLKGRIASEEASVEFISREPPERAVESR